MGKDDLGQFWEQPQGQFCGQFSGQFCGQFREQFVRQSSGNLQAVPDSDLAVVWMSWGSRAVLICHLVIFIISFVAILSKAKNFSMGSNYRITVIGTLSVNYFWIEINSKTTAEPVVQRLDTSSIILKHATFELSFFMFSWPKLLFFEFIFTLLPLL